jgi:cytochrome c-type biogenesis protein CcmE
MGSSVATTPPLSVQGRPWASALASFLLFVLPEASPEDTMNHVRLKLIGGGLAIAAAVSFLAVAGIRDGWVYYLPVDDFVADGEYQSRRVRLHGTVGEQDLLVEPALLTADFRLLGEQNSVRIAYAGIIPDQFQSGREVVVEGRLDDHGVFQSDMLLTKCASKYETADGQAPHAEPDTREPGE